MIVLLVDNQRGIECVEVVRDYIFEAQHVSIKLELHFAAPVLSEPRTELPHYFDDHSDVRLFAFDSHGPKCRGLEDATLVEPRHQHFGGVLELGWLFP